MDYRGLDEPLLPMPSLVIVRSLCSQQDLTRVLDQLNPINHVEVKYSELSSAELEPWCLLQCWMWCWCLLVCSVRCVWRCVRFMGRCLCLGFHWLFSRYCGFRYIDLNSWMKQEARKCKPFLGCLWQKKLYVFHHSALQGRMNITDVYDSLYDYILRYMSWRVGRKSIIFIVDNVQDGKTAQNNIKVEQPTLSQCCNNIFIFQNTEENGWNQLEDHRLKKYLQAYFNTIEVANVE
uniref:Uncharacterized LOC103189732 n=1 Tax=Callorhinchus milii TaxID=7868 RepID=A0A4W3HUF8_CALMI|eukprot:gi/632982989/ref/XP_007908426.1/ PREDICTED: uncharacterized protein LOC103189732 [Callorhinchus milii]